MKKHIDLSDLEYGSDKAIENEPLNIEDFYWIADIIAEMIGKKLMPGEVHSLLHSLRGS